MKYLLLLLPLLLFAKTPFETLDMSDMDLSAYETKKGEQNLQASKNVKVTCRLVCDKKIYKEQKISDAIEFYKKAKKKNPSNN